LEKSNGNGFIGPARGKIREEVEGWGRGGSSDRKKKAVLRGNGEESDQKGGEAEGTIPEN